MSDEALLAAAKAGDFPKVQALLGRDISLEEAFCRACAFAGLDVIKALINAGVDVNAMSEEGATPLIWAVQYDRPAIVDELLKAGASAAVRVPHGDAFRDADYKKTPLELARAKSSKKIVELLEAIGGKPTVRPKRAAGADTVVDSWKRIGLWLEKNAPGWKALREPANADQVASAEKELGFSLPADLRESYLIHNGSGNAQVFPWSSDYSYCFYALSELVSDWNMMKKLHDQGEFLDCIAKSDRGIRDDWWNVGWIPFSGNGAGDTYCIDLMPATGGNQGQVIATPHDSERRQLLAPSLREWLASLADGLEDGMYTYAGRGGIV